MSTLRERFQRTACDCPACSRHCRHMPGALAPGDLDRIGAYLGLSQEDGASLFAASPGALVMRDGVPFRIGTIVPRRRESGACVFLDERGLCRIHPVAPFSCAFFDDHMSAAEGNRRSVALLKTIMQDDEYQQQREKLIQLGQTTLAPEVLRAQYERELTR